jgi:hypothetical protein
MVGLTETPLARAARPPPLTVFAAFINEWKYSPHYFRLEARQF